MKLFQNIRPDTRPKVSLKVSSKVSLKFRWLARPALLLTLLASLAVSSCASHRSLSQKTRWYKHHSGGKSIPCPCDH